jgi:hypothetical protein
MNVVDFIPFALCVQGVVSKGRPPSTSDDKG